MAIIGDLTPIELRRNLHMYPEAGWKEFRTTALVAEELEDCGYTISLGSDALEVSKRLGVPSADDIETAEQRARTENAPEKYIERMDGVTGLVAEKELGDGTGPIVGLRVDMDALARPEASDESHYPVSEGFASRHANEMHACGHDGHTAIGVGVAREIDADSTFDGTLRLFFQPAEEGGRGGLPMSETEHLSDIDYLFALHLGLDNETGRIIAGYERPLSNAKIDVVFTGESSHAGKAPQEGRNALQAATTAIQNVYAIPRHEQGATRINVGQVYSPNAQNVISEMARMRVEVRGKTAELNEYMLDKVQQTIEHAAGMHGVSYETSLYGKTTTFTADEVATSIVADAAKSVSGVTDITRREDLGASEDASYLIKRVQELDGKATYIGIGASNPFGHHTARFDINEASLQIGIDTVSAAIRNC